MAPKKGHRRHDSPERSRSRHSSLSGSSHRARSRTRRDGHRDSRRGRRAPSRSSDVTRRRSRTPESSRRRHTRNTNSVANKCLALFGLSQRTNEKDLKVAFARYGPIEECTVVMDWPTGRSRQFGFIHFESVEDAKAAKASGNRMEIDGRMIRVDFSTTQPSKVSTDNPPSREGGNDSLGHRRSPSPCCRQRRRSRPRTNGPYH